MKKSIPVNKKSRGRPKKQGGVDPVSAVRLPATLTKQVDTWSEVHGATRSEAIRRLVELGLKVKTPARKVSKPGRRLRAQELAKSDREDDRSRGTARRTSQAQTTAHEGPNGVSRGPGRSAQAQE
jgi:hypothetical protein